MKYAKDANGSKIVPGDIVHHIGSKHWRYEVMSLYCEGLDPNDRNLAYGAVFRNIESESDRRTISPCKVIKEEISPPGSGDAGLIKDIMRGGS